MATTVFPKLNVDSFALVLGAVIAVGFLGLGAWATPARPSASGAAPHPAR